MTRRTMNKSAVQVVDEVKAEPTTWTAHYLAPLAQNITCGLAVGALCLGSYIAVQTWRDAVWYVEDAALWCVLAGGAVTCIATVIRFFGDDLGLITKAYKAGQHSRNGQINALLLEIRTLRDATHAAQADGTASSAVKREAEFMTRALNDAKALTRAHFQGNSITRAVMGELGMGQRDWERAVRLLKAVGAMDSDGVIVAKVSTQVISALNERILIDKQRGDKFTPSWK